MDPWAEIMGLWAALMAEPKWWAIIGLGLDLVGGVLVAFTAWFRVSVEVPWSSDGVEPAESLKVRQRMVLSGAGALSAGFGIQIWSTALQIPG